MKKENILIFAIICILAAGVMGYATSEPETRVAKVSKTTGSPADNAGVINWQDYAGGMELAKTSGKHVFLYFYADWCTYCTKLKKTTFQEQEVLNYLKENFVSISVDTDVEKARAGEWKVRGLPTLWFLKPDNSEISNIPGYVDKDQFLTVLKYIHTQSYDKMSLTEFVKTI
jgi:thioredoxin-related protein